MMQEFDKECLQVFLENQYQLFSDFPAQTMQEAKDFLEDVMAVVVNSPQEVKEYLDEAGLDTAGMSMEEILNQSEVFKLPKKCRYMIVQG